MKILDNFLDCSFNITIKLQVLTYFLRHKLVMFLFSLTVIIQLKLKWKLKCRSCFLYKKFINMKKNIAEHKEVPVPVFLEIRFCVSVKSMINVMFFLVSALTDRVISGHQALTSILYEPDIYPKAAVGPVEVMWNPQNSTTYQVWIWCHTCIHETVLSTLTLLLTGKYMYISERNLVCV